MNDATTVDVGALLYDAMVEWHPGYATVSEVMRVYDVSCYAQVYRLAHRHHWRRYTLCGHVRYHRGDVSDSMSLTTP